MVHRSFLSVTPGNYNENETFKVPHNHSNCGYLDTLHQVGGWHETIGYEMENESAANLC